jgi:hypothetical protein
MKVVQSGLVLRFSPEHDLVFIQDNCLTQVRYNAMRGDWRPILECGGRIVIGSLGLGITDPWFEYGGRDFQKVHQFKSSDFTTNDGRWDAHAWLEDEDGNVWDFITPYMKSVAKVRNKVLHEEPSSPAGLCIIRGKSKLECARFGLHYVATDKLTSDVLSELMVPFDGSMLDKICLVPFMNN